MKSKPLNVGQRNGPGGQGLAAATRWALSAILALSCLAALGDFASPGSSTGPTAPPARLGLVRLAAPNSEKATASATPREATTAVAATTAEEPDSMEATDRQQTLKQEFDNTREATEIPDQRSQATPASSNAGHGAEAVPPRQPAPEPQNQLGSEEESLPPPDTANPPESAESRNSDDAEAQPSVAAAATTRDSDPPAANTGQARQEIDVAQLDAGFGMLGPVAPVFPVLAKRLRKAGRVRLELGINQEGRVYRINVVDENPGLGFGPSAESAYRNARFTRPTVRGRPVRVLWRKTVIFDISRP